MGTEPRRKDRTMKTTQEMELLLERMPVGRLAVMTMDGPCIVAVNYLFFEGCIYLHPGGWPFELNGSIHHFGWKSIDAFSCTNR
jgi:hypothetical protein